MNEQQFGQFAKQIGSKLEQPSNENKKNNGDFDSQIRRIVREELSFLKDDIKRMISESNMIALNEGQDSNEIILKLGEHILKGDIRIVNSK